MLNKKIFIYIALVLGIIFYSCESNDALKPIVTIPPSADTNAKKIVLEFFTNSGCIPCVNAHALFNQMKDPNVIVTTNDTNIYIVSIHVQYPFPPDSLYVANALQNTQRASYYGVTFTPNARLDGVNMGAFDAQLWTAEMNAELSQTIYTKITLQNNYNTSTDSGTVTANVNVINPIPTTDNVIHIYITQDSIYYPTAPNGIDWFDDVVRRMATGSAGESITLTNGNTTTFSKGYRILPAWKREHCFITVFVQSTSTKAVYGAGRIKVLP